MSYPAYPAYKDSNIDWLGQIPTHWQVTRFKHMCSQSALYGANESSASYADDGIRFLRTTDITDQGDLISSDAAVYLDEALVSDYLLNDGDILLSRSGTVGRSFVYDSLLHGKCAYAGYLVRFVPKDDSNPRFIYYFTKSKEFEEWLSSSTISSTIGNVNGQKYANMPLPMPSLEEQTRIASFLDAETAQIDTLIAKQERLIALLQEKRQALISHAVTRGLNPDAPMKESGVEWLGEVPAHWKILKLKRIASLKSGSGINSDKIEPEGDYPVFGGNGIRGYTEQYSHEGCYALIGRQGALCGNINYAEGRFWASEHAVVVSPTTDLVTKWLGELLRAMNLNQYSISAAQPGLSVEMVSNLFVPFPSFIEQQSIATFLIQETAQIDTLIEKANATIAVLQERRTALISAAVTGKIDVRAVMN